MKLISKILLAVSVVLVAAPSGMAQNEVPDEGGVTVRRAAGAKSRGQKKSDPASSLSNRAKSFNELLSQKTDGTPWERVIYRRLDLTKDSNAPLYYPVRARDGMRNLFSTVFDLLNQDAIAVYEYMDGYEAFDEEHRLQFKDFLDRTQIMYAAAPKESGRLFKIEPSDIPSNNIKAYYIKELWYFNPQNSAYDLKILALCPILSDVGDYGEESNTPLFWIPYENIRPYIARQKAMLSSLNNVHSATLDDFFRMRMYRGDIVMASNLLDRSIAQYCNTPDSIKMEQKRIELELKNFEKGLYATQDSTWMNRKMEGKTGKSAKSINRKRTSRTKETAKSDPKPKKVKAAKPAKTSASKSKSSGRSSRRRY
ncbi:gliding motility associated protein GldN [Porphyromonas crevioricanis]|uniref:Gliding motility associated protein GldN n=1 Tax=Porphyromonas crevioricanis TaxID=393921 RepID=A0A2X4PLS3_9PORP|nr:gliding motility protein GldN [Porphyromonas crevioricanis]GAD06703.1 hypothetical protein PORCAN_302 [Porphyromonas crevioricanis JCM 13913]SQH73325.1 gliding motility associated protein GldN [Porphyromonas crevioricanis]